MSSIDPRAASFPWELGYVRAGGSGESPDTREPVPSLMRLMKSRPVLPVAPRRPPSGWETIR
jgi:hypothetical protein